MQMAILTYLNTVNGSKMVVFIMARIEVPNGLLDKLTSRADDLNLGFSTPTEAVKDAVRSKIKGLDLEEIIEYREKDIARLESELKEAKDLIAELEDKPSR